MNLKMIRYVIGLILFLGAVLMLPSLIVSIIYQEPSGWSIFAAMLLCGAAGFLLHLRPPKDRTMHAREGYVIVALSWVVLSAFGALPFVFSGAIPSYLDAYFETVSGFTTTGASILTDIEAMPKGLLFWRSFTHWIGGMGVLVFVMAILPVGGASNMYMMKAESTGPAVGKLVPKVRTTASILYRLYLSLSVAMLVFLLIGRMPLYDSLITVFGTAGTGGFHITADSMGCYSTYLQNVTTIFMILFGINFSAYFLIIAGKAKDALHITEVRVYLAIILVSIVLISINAFGMYGNVFETVQQSAFQVATIITTTGYATTDFDLWPMFSKSILIVLMFIGACAGSTGGGMKVQRVVILGKQVKRELDVIAHPRHVEKMRLDGHAVDDGVIHSVLVFLAAYFAIFVASLLIVSLDDFDFTTCFTSVAATLNNIGPGLSLVGPTGNYSGFSALSKIVLSFDMLAGRLEVFPMLVLFSRNTWRK